MLISVSWSNVLIFKYDVTNMNRYETNFQDM